MTAPPADSYSRTKKLFVDSGEASTFAEADEIVQSYVLQVHVGPVASNATLQAAVLTIVNSAAARFRGRCPRVDRGGLRRRHGLAVREADLRSRGRLRRDPRRDSRRAAPDGVRR